MSDLNRVVLVGRLTRDMDLRYTSSGVAVGAVPVAVNRRRKDGDQWIEEVSFFDVSLYGKLAETLKPYLVKGKQVAVDGELRQNRWEQDGQTRRKVVIVANNVQLLGGNAGDGNTGGAHNNAGWQQRMGQNQGIDEGDFPEDIPY